jgi:formamidase
MPETLIKVDLSKSAYDNDMIHNRWHPDIPMVAWVNPGDDFIIETYDWTGGFIKNNDSADDVRDIDLSIVHFLSGPIGVKGAEPGDLLVVDLLDVGPLKESLWGFQRLLLQAERRRLPDRSFPAGAEIDLGHQGPLHVVAPRARREFAGLIHPGLIGCLPDPKLLATWNERETALIATNPTRVPGPRQSAVRRDRACRPRQGRRQGQGRREGARTVPPREHGGNCDIKDLSRGSKDLLPGLCAGRRPLDGRPAFQPGRRRDHLLRRDRDGRLAAHQGRHHQGRRGQVRHQEPRVQAVADHAELQGLSDLRGHLGRRGRQAALTSTSTSPTARPA